MENVNTIIKDMPDTVEDNCVIKVSMKNGQVQEIFICEYEKETKTMKRYIGKDSDSINKLKEIVNSF